MYVKGRVAGYLPYVAGKVEGVVRSFAEEFLANDVLPNNVEFVGQGPRHEIDKNTAQQIVMAKGYQIKEAAERLLVLKAYQLYQMWRGEEPYLPREVVEMKDYHLGNQVYQSMIQDLDGAVRMHEFIDRAVSDAFWDKNFTILALYDFVWSKFFISASLDSRHYGKRKYY